MEEKLANDTLVVSHQDAELDVDSKLEEHHLGIWRMFIEKDAKSHSTKTRMRTLRSRDQNATWSVLRRFFRDIIHIAAGPVAFSVLGHVVSGILPVMDGVLASRILRVFENAITNRYLDTRTLIMAVVFRSIMQKVTTSVVGWCHVGSEPLNARVGNYFHGIMFAGKLRMDLPTTLQDKKDYTIQHGGGDDAVRSTLEIVTELFHIVGHVGFLSLGIRGPGSTTNINSPRLGLGMTFSVLCLVRPLSEVIPILLPDYTRRVYGLFLGLGARSWIMSTPRVVETTNEDFHRSASWSGLVEKEYKMDIISGNLVEHVINQQAKSARALEGTARDSPEIMFMEQSPSSGAGWAKNLRLIIQSLTQDCINHLPMAYYTIRVMRNPSEISLATIATLQTSMWSIHGLCYSVLRSYLELQRAAMELRGVYDLEVVNNIVKDEGWLSFPGEESSEEGVAVELRNVTFRYPGSQNITSALDDVSFKIGAGDLTVVVGANGSGKSTLINVLSRLYDTTSGQVLLNGVDIKDYKLNDIRKSIAILTQDHQLFPGLSLKENIGLGDIECLEDEAEGQILEAVMKGGADNVIGKLEKGMDTVLDSRVVRYSQLLDEEDETNPLAIKFKQLQKTSNVSGGERQRLVASRAFMRIQSKKIKFVAVDEPTSALDPEGELALFTRLREARKGKTMIFITHRFGPLTKHADNIICMKDGKILEFGNHAALMEMNGEYCKMYNIQANPFQP
ncbi:hypothetical protein PM082_000239 [Marasmius tenuissimus]|nr:hypothetical protein PM082_000239 [Marasmius tenuissimus]